MQESNEAPPQQAMMQLMAGFWISRAVHAAAVLGLADLLESPRTANQLAIDTGMHSRSMYRLMRALASVGVFRERDDGRFESTPLSDTLKSAGDGSLRYTAISELGLTHYGPWGELLQSLKNGKPSFDAVFGMPIFDWFARNPDRSEIFNRSMSELTALVEPAVLDAYDFSGLGTIVDVGGGHGSLLAGILQKHPSLRGIVFDAPEVVAGTPEKLRAAGVADRCTTASGDFFASVVPGGDTYIMKHIIHDWDDDKCRTILTHCRSVMKPGSKILVVDQVLPGRNEPSLGKFSDLIMMVMPGGQERTEDEFRTLLESAGFTFSRVVPTRSIVSVVEGVAK